MMQITALPYSELGARHFDAWRRIRNNESTFDSPFFCPEFTQAVASVRDDVCVGIMQQDGAIVGLFPFQRGSRGDATAVGGGVSQFHGVIVEQGIVWNADQLLKSCQLNSWAFDHLPASQTPFERHFRCVGGSPFIDLTNGFEAYCADKKKSGKVVEQAFRKARKLQREIGPLRFELHDGSDDCFRCLLAWKSDQHRRTNVSDSFQQTWLVALLDRIRQTQTESFAGLLSALFAGEHLVALHLGIRSETVFHSWYPAYDIAFGKHSAGITLLLKLAEALAASGVRRIDFSPRPQIYKTRLMSGAISVAKGVADRSRLKAYVRRGTETLREHVRETPLAGPIRAPIRLLRSVGKWWAD